MQLVATQPVIGFMSSVRPGAPLSVERPQYLRLRCPACRSDIATLPYHSLNQLQEPVACLHCSTKLRQQQGIWLALLESRQEYFAGFIRDYEIVRKVEGRGSDD